MTEPLARPDYAVVDGVRVYYDRCGDGGRQIVFVHTAGTHAGEWRYVLEKVASSGYECYALDLPWHGKSDPIGSSPPETIHEYGEFVYAFIRALCKRPFVVGCSIGGCIALDLAVSHGRDIAGAIAIAATARNRSVSPLLLEMAREDAGSPSWSDRAALSAFQSTGSVASPERIVELQRVHRSSDPHVMAADLRAWNAHDLRHMLAGVHCRMHVLLGEDDYFIPAASRSDLIAQLGEENVTSMKTVGHYPMVEWYDFPDWLIGRLTAMSQAEPVSSDDRLAHPAT
jgi:pimeloyl-ACP methyl ester carboxylesterase